LRVLILVSSLFRSAFYKEKIFNNTVIQAMCCCLAARMAQ
jgi:hypothetical protein